jgi:uncharacterized protein
LCRGSRLLVAALAGVFGVVLLLPPSALRAQDTIDYGAFNAAVVDSYVLPRYAAFAEATARLEASLRKACADGRLDAAESAEDYHGAMDAWMAVQHLRFGPGELLLRYDRLEFWPDKRGTVRRHLAQMLSTQDPETLAPETLAQGSVAVQGFPALERLLFDIDESVWASPFGCDLAVAIGINLHGIASDLTVEWRDGPQAYGEMMRSAAVGNARYQDAREASLELAKALRGALLLIADYKLERPLGGAADSARTERAESWRSARSLRNVTINLRSARALYADTVPVSFSSLVAAQPQGGELDEAILAAFDRLVAQAELQPGSLEAALAAENGWPRLDALRQETRQLLELLGGPLSQVLDLPIGFNSYDGD